MTTYCWLGYMLIPKSLGDDLVGLAHYLYSRFHPTIKHDSWSECVKQLKGYRYEPYYSVWFQYEFTDFMLGSPVMIRLYNPDSGEIKDLFISVTRGKVWIGNNTFIPMEELRNSLRRIT